MQTVSRTPESKKAGLTAAQILIELKAVNFRPEEPYTLTAGWKSPVYIDVRKIISYPRARRKIIDLAVDHLEREVGFEQFDAVAGGETAGIPYAAWVSDALGLPMQYVRKKPKGFGRNAQIEGTFPEGARVLLVEDLATDGGSKLTFIEALRSAGAEVKHCFVVFHYGIFPQSTASLAEQGVALQGLATWWDVLAVAEERGRLTSGQVDEVRRFLRDPDGWAEAQAG